MINSHGFKSLLLFNIDLADKIDVMISDIALMYVLPLMFVGIIWELASTNNVMSVGKSTILAIFLIFSFTKIYKTSVDYSFDIAYEIIKTRGGNKNSFIKAWNKLVKTSVRKEKSLDSKFSRAINIIKGSDDFVLSLISIGVFCILVLTSVFYTLGYYLNYIFIALSALIGILPLTRSALLAPVKGLLWSCIVPIICATIVALMGSIMEVRLNSEGQMAFDLKTYVEIGVLALSMLFILPGVYFFINGKSMGEIASNMAGVAGKGFIYSAAGVAGKSALSAGDKYLARPVKKFSSIAANSIGKVAASEMGKHSVDNNVDENLNKNIPEIFQDKVNKDISNGKSVVGALVNPKNHVAAASQRIQNVGTKLKTSAPVKVYQNASKESGRVSALRSASIVGTNSAIKLFSKKNSGINQVQSDYKEKDFQKGIDKEARYPVRYARKPRQKQKFVNLRGVSRERQVKRN